MADAVDQKTASRDDIVLNLMSHIRGLDKEDAWELLEKVSEILDRKDDVVQCQGRNCPCSEKGIE